MRKITTLRSSEIGSLTHAKGFSKLKTFLTKERHMSCPRQSLQVERSEAQSENGVAGRKTNLWVEKRGGIKKRIE